MNAPQVMRTAAGSLREFAKRADKWRIQEDGFAAIGPGLKAAYRNGRRAMRKAAGSSDPDLYHLWRKRAKDHWYHVRLLSELWGETSQSREGCLHDLETALGDDHNLEVLCAEVSEDSDAFGDKGAAELFTAAARAKQQRLRARALELGERLYEPKPKELIRDFERMWDIWRAEPEELTAAAT